MHLKKFVTIRDVAKAAGVSINTVSRALNNKPDINKETKEKVLKVAKELGYIKDATATSLRYGLTKVIGVILEDSSNPFYSEVLKAVEMAARRRGFNVIFMNTEKDYELEEEAVRTMLSRRVDGIIIAPTQEKSGDIQLLMKASVPFVILGVHFDEIELPEVYSNDVRGSYLAVSHLIERGRKKIVYLSGFLYKSVARMRLEGYRKALHEHLIPFDQSYVFEVEEGVENSYRKMIEIIESGLEFDGVFCFNDISAIGAIQALREKGYLVPKDVSVVGYDDIAFAHFIQPRLTTVRIDKQREGEQAFELLYEMIKRKEIVNKQIVLDVELVVRETT
ncbi:transcriptional regulator, LacI family [Fervidobacterium changbaicum]|uniref:LacI family transcriptional regulator n=1 Tax=Fervidobacterium islandicum TaxID=2423 RepID=A0AAJ5I2Z0_FERIS|nr:MULTISPECIES: LacI family DNA-binding transcriptional regulator [Fervidobacterium]UOE96847.1 LacI family transcriptional regulator [Fervidobacterium islandicum]SDH34353.1 transcriptional regulator, LacI family [Fervidobacterium changbaicum]